VLAVLGGLSGLIAFTALEWFKRPRQFSDVHDAVRAAHAGGFDTGIGLLYFDWLAWALLAAAAGVALLANLPWAPGPALRALGAVLGLAGFGVTFWAIKFFHGPPYTWFLKHAHAGFYFALCGFLLTTVASLLRPRRTG
jgi:hypothetical protein